MINSRWLSLLDFTKAYHYLTHNIKDKVMKEVHNITDYEEYEEPVYPVDFREELFTTIEVIRKNTEELKLALDLALDEISKLSNLSQKVAKTTEPKPATHKKGIRVLVASLMTDGKIRHVYQVAEIINKKYKTSWTEAAVNSSLHYMLKAGDMKSPRRGFYQAVKKDAKA